VVEARRVLHDTILGLNSIKRDPAKGFEKIEKALRKLTKLPLQDGNGAGIKHINNLVLIGESAGGSQLYKILKRVLGDRIRIHGSADDSVTLESVTPLFAGSRGIAMDCLGRLQYKASQV
jgi:hypothetical protein